MTQFLKARYIIVIFALTLFGFNSWALTAEEVYAKAKDSIYTLYSLDFKTKHAKGRGSAVAVGKNILATNCHIALAGNFLLVKINNKPIVASLFFKDEDKDLCLLEVPNGNFMPAEMRNSDTVKIGESVYAIGNPQGTEKSLSKGIISNKHAVAGGGVWLQTDATIYFGSSGGGLFDEDGKLIGITAKMGGNFGFAIPTEWILQVLYPKRFATNTSPAEKSKTESDYSQAHANLIQLGTYGRSQISLYRNNKECFLTIPGHGKQNRLLGLALWNPKYAEKLLIFSSATSVKSALELLLKSVIEQKNQDQSKGSYQSDNILHLGGNDYRLYGAQSSKERYAYFVAYLEEQAAEQLGKLKQFSADFHDSDPRIGEETVIYELDGFAEALADYKKQCGG